MWRANEDKAIESPSGPYILTPIRNLGALTGTEDSTKRCRSTESSGGDNIVHADRSLLYIALVIFYASYRDARGA